VSDIPLEFKIKWIKLLRKWEVLKKNDNALEVAIASKIVMEVVYAQMEAYSLN
jgi:hypothetical protein